MSARIIVPGVESLTHFVGAEFGPGDWLTVDQARIDAFAAATGDDQWIHLDAERAQKESSNAPIERAFQLILKRPPTAAELKAVQTIPLHILCRSLINSNEFAFLP